MRPGRRHGGPRYVGLLRRDGRRIGNAFPNTRAKLRVCGGGERAKTLPRLTAWDAT
jgi:hypothetical protein